MKMKRRTSAIATSIGVYMLAGVADLLAAASAVEPPPNTPAEVRWDAGKGTLQLRYHGKVILDATVAAMDAAGTTVSTGVKLEPGEMGDAADKVEQRLRLVPAEPADGIKLVLRGTVTGSEEAFPAETTPISPPSGPTQWLPQGPPSKSKLLAANPHFPALRSDPMAASGAALQKQITSSSKLLAAHEKIARPSCFSLR
ncbi:MAG: hypothetical protein O3A92_16115 [Verrucomicrobia bacterium]|nr:hypothetical protein [Verrucomicrobiota bacterium]